MRILNPREFVARRWDHACRLGYNHGEVLLLCCQAKATGMDPVRGLEFQYQQPHSSRFRSREVICKQDLTPAGSPLPRVPSTLHPFPCPVGWGWGEGCLPDFLPAPFPESSFLSKGVDRGHSLLSPEACGRETWKSEQEVCSLSSSPATQSHAFGVNGHSFSLSPPRLCGWVKDILGLADTDLTTHYLSFLYGVRVVTTVFLV